MEQPTQNEWTRSPLNLRAPTRSSRGRHTIVPALDLMLVLIAVAYFAANAVCGYLFNRMMRTKS